MGIKKALLGVAIALVVAAPACKSRRQTGAAEDAGGMVSVLPMSDPHAKQQIVSGFYQLESSAWRWTGAKFSVNLQPPAAAATHGGKLVFKLVIPDPVLRNADHITLSAKVGDTTLPPETYNKAGEYTYNRDVPAAALQTNSVRVSFWVDRTIPPSPADGRELGVIAQQVGLEPK